MQKKVKDIMKNKNKLKKRKQFNWTFKNGTSIHSKNMVIVFHESKGRDYKVGFSVTKKVGKAVTRNKTKRRLREIVTKYRHNILGKNTIIFVAKPSITEISFWDMMAEVEMLLKKAKLYKEA